MKEKIVGNLIDMALATAATCVAALVCYWVYIPNPSILLLTFTAVCLSWRGYLAGIASALITFHYDLFFYSEGHNFVTFTTQNMHKMEVVVICIVLNILFIGRLHQKYAQTIQKLSHEKAKLESISKADPLTGMNNRYAFQVRFDSFVGKKMGVAVLDIDRFKSFNDQHGHGVGDEVIQTVARELTREFGSEDCFRWGGDEFLVASEALDGQALEEKLCRLELRLREERIGDFPIGITGGYAVGRVESDEELRELITRADKDLYAKKARKKLKRS